MWLRILQAEARVRCDGQSKIHVREKLNVMPIFNYESGNSANTIKQPQH
jgi:hypothetical protein